MDDLIEGLIKGIGGLIITAAKASGRDPKEIADRALAEARKHGDLGGPGGEWTKADDKRKERGGSRNPLLTDESDE